MSSQYQNRSCCYHAKSTHCTWVLRTSNLINSSSNHHTVPRSCPCVRTYEKLVRGEVSSSLRVATFLSTASSCRVHIRHIDGVPKLPSDFESRNPGECHNSDCQFCKFVQEMAILGVSMGSVIGGSAKTPFTSRVVWHATQLECPDLRHTHAQCSLHTNTCPSLQFAVKMYALIILLIRTRSHQNQPASVRL